MPHLKMWEIMQRAAEGPYCEDDEFLYDLFLPKMKEVVRKYEIEFDPGSPVPADDDLADRVWLAAVEFFLAVGVHNVDTHRRILISEAELNEALYLAPEQHVVGAGHETRFWRPRRVEDERPPFCIFSPDITYDEDIFLQASMAYVQEPLADGVCGPILEESLGRNITSGTPSEMVGVMEHAMLLRNATKLVGRPGLFLVAVGTAQSDVGQVAVSNNEWGVRSSDGRLIGVLTEMKTDNELLNKVAHCKQFGCAIGCLTGAIYGGYAGGAEGTAVLETAHHLVGLTVYQHNFNNSFPFHIQHTSNSGREMLWLVSLVQQALSRNSRILSTSNGFFNAGPGTEMLFREASAHAIASVVSGGDLWTAAPRHNKHRNYATPLEARLACEVGHAVARQRMPRAQANEIVDQLLVKYETQIAEAPAGKPFQECYEVMKVRPQAWYLDQYQTVKQELHALGVEFPY